MSTNVLTTIRGLQGFRLSKRPVEVILSTANTLYKGLLQYFKDYKTLIFESHNMPVHSEEASGQYPLC